MINKSILLVDDEEIILSSIAWVLEKNNFKVTTAINGREAIDLLEANRYDLIITDLRMNGIDGVAVLKQAKILSPDTRAIILTGYGDVESAVKTLKLGADDYLQKPCNIEDLLYRVSRSFETQDLVVKLREQNEQLKNEIASRKAIEIKLQESHANLEEQVEKRTAELNSSVDELKTVLNTLFMKEKELKKKNRELLETNTTLSTLLKRREQEHKDIKQDMAAQTREMVLPLLRKAQKGATGYTKNYIETAKANLLDISSEHSHDIVLTNAKLSPRELQIVHYIRQDKTSKEMADILNLKVSTIESYRENIRKKLRLTNQKTNLKKFITSHL
ncbi:response regulator [Desulforhopalus sp. IMCC35007]|uniref:response regulator n=1 Tax=Desulforhopalus sp. IMCC35007 TaxID=2569543 RepID=UPI0010AE1151|nr:response regulator [Desulforhopalus sp. IMCC35007]TKB06362.1 response regulator [Desulforhopalus sp. IMCC35007]